MNSLGVRAFARRQRVSPSAVVQAIAAGRLRAAVTYDARRRPRIDPERGDREWRENAARGRTPGNRRRSGRPSKAASLAEAQRRVAEERAKALALQNAIRSGDYIRAEVATRAGFEAARLARNAVLAVPDRVAAELAAESDPEAVHRRLTAELTAALESVAAQLTPSPPRRIG